ncbi:DNA-binding transcriptional regulator, Lrp family [Paramicrobacterium humi]|uniref:DNA-binding transcriptional regulator, Lrp family n=1 Tax=Paramicrobacterium humi TaxID=640635 RepID=A0A1H4KXK0_9MICO|nr:Lrp/AsnC family transcriptional regulator [Microbacterium humi]SEB62825.1 DNA-binding transcriptional regulator, Lrp family [Microbacterium humi]
MVLESARLGVAWRLPRLRSDQADALTEHRVAATSPQISNIGNLSDVEFATKRELGRDARISAAEVGRILHVSSSTAARAIRTLLQSGAVVPRVEIEPAVVGYPLLTAVSLDVKPRAIGAVVDTLAQHPSARMISTVTGASSISFHGVFAGPVEFSQFLKDDLGALPSVRTMSSAVGLRIARRYWHDRDGFRIGDQVPNVLRR